MADAYTKRVFNVVTGQTITYLTLPALTGAGTGGTVLTVGAGGSWGAYADLAAAGAITTTFWVCGEGIFTGDTGPNFQFDVFNATLSTTLFSWSIQTTVPATVNAGPFMIPLPIRCALGSQIQGRVGSVVGAAGKTINAYLVYAVGL